MKLVIVYHYFAHYRKAVINELINTARDHNDSIIFIADNHANEPNLKVYDFSDNEKYFKKVKNCWLGKFLWQKGILKKIYSESPDVIIFLGQFNFISTWIASIVFKLLGKKILFWGHGVYGSETGLKKIIRDLFNNLPHIYMTYGEHAKRLMSDRKKISVIYNSLDVDRQDKYYNTLVLDEKACHSPHMNCVEKTKLLFVGRLTKIKKLDILLKALNHLDRSLYELLIIGTGPEEKNLKDLVDKCGLNDIVYFKGALHDEKQLSLLIYSSDICVSPGNVGLTAMHALVYGTPVITNDDFSHQMPEFEVIEPGVNGDFFVDNDILSLADKIEKWRLIIAKVGRDEIRDKCRRPVLEFYNPKNQARLIWENVKKDDADI